MARRLLGRLASRAATGEHQPPPSASAGSVTLTTVSPRHPRLRSVTGDPSSDLRYRARTRLGRRACRWRSSTESISVSAHARWRSRDVGWAYTAYAYQTLPIDHRPRCSYDQVEHGARRLGVREPRLFGQERIRRWCVRLRRRLPATSFHYDCTALTRATPLVLLRAAIVRAVKGAAHVRGDAIVDFSCPSGAALAAGGNRGSGFTDRIIGHGRPLVAATYSGLDGPDGYTALADVGLCLAAGARVMPRQQ